MRSTFPRLILLILLVAVPASAQLATIASEPVFPDRAVPSDMATYGTLLPTVLVIPEFNFSPFNSDVTWNWSGGRYLTSLGSMQAGLVLPTGVSVFAFELEACDTSDAGQVELALFHCVLGSCNALGAVATGFAETPGCEKFFLPLGAPHTVDNSGGRLIFQFSNSTVDGTTRILAARIGYFRQVSPAPETASFGDVPVGSPLHQYIEALVASGITAGCGGGNFCPNQAVTRGQMAVFIAKALGLHWAP